MVQTTKENVCVRDTTFDAICMEQARNSKLKSGDRCHPLLLLGGS